MEGQVGESDSTDGRTVNDLILYIHPARLASPDLFIPHAGRAPFLHHSSAAAQSYSSAQPCRTTAPAYCSKLPP